MTFGQAMKGVIHAVSRAFAFMLSLPIRFYRLFISPMLGPNCRYDPTCSAYALEALDVHGPLKGSFLAARRILSCHPVKWLGGGEGHDPVPPRHRHTDICHHGQLQLTARSNGAAEGKEFP